MDDSARKQKENIEIDMLLEVINQNYGYDFRNYARAHAKRRILHFLATRDIESISMLQHHILEDVDLFHSFLFSFSVHVTEIFRDPDFYRSLRTEVIPFLRTFPFIKIWNAGCSTGEETYSLAILLHEEALLDRCLIYATDINDSSLETAKNGIYDIKHIKTYTKNYQQSGGTQSFSDYFRADDAHVIIKSALKEKILFTNHNLVSDGVFGEMQLVVCRNVLIYFDRILQERSLRLFHESLCFGGFLCLGAKESIGMSPLSELYREIAPRNTIYKKIANTEAEYR